MARGAAARARAAGSIGRRRRALAAAAPATKQEFRAFGGAAAGPRGTLLNAGAAGEVIGSKEPRRGGAAAGAGAVRELAGSTAHSATLAALEASYGGCGGRAYVVVAPSSSCSYTLAPYSMQLLPRPIGRLAPLVDIIYTR